jgi:hypothetical protein
LIRHDQLLLTAADFRRILVERPVAAQLRRSASVAGLC